MNEKVEIIGDYILSFDIGTTAIKVGLFSISGSLASFASREQRLLFPHPGWVEQSLTETWKLIIDATTEALSKVHHPRVISIVLTSHRGSAVPIGRNHEPLTNLIVWMDRRGLQQIERLNTLIGKNKYYLIAGHPIEVITGVSKVLWLHKEAPEIWSHIDHIGAPQTLFLNWLGCDDTYVDLSTGSYLFPCNIKKGVWSEEIANKLSFPLEKLPKLVSATEIVGQLNKNAAEQLGLVPGIPIIAGGGDGQCAAAGTGVVVPGKVMVNIGTATGVQVFLSEPKFDQGQVLNCAAHVVLDSWEMEGHTQASGTVLRWFRDELGDIEKSMAHHSKLNEYDLLVDHASIVPAGSDGLIFFPTFNGSTAPILDPNLRGAFIGLKLEHKRNHLIRAMLEGISLEIRWMLDTISTTGVPVDEIRLVGGGSKNSQWNQIHADILNHPIRTMENPEAALIGAAMCAAVGIGIYPDFNSAGEAFLKYGTTYEPNQDNSVIYEKSYERFVRLMKLCSEQNVFIT